MTVKSTEQLQNHSLKSSPFHQLFENRSVLHTARDWKIWQDKDTFSKPGNSLIKQFNNINAQVHIQYNTPLAHLSYQTRLGLQPCYMQERRNAVVNKVRRHEPPVYTLTQHPTGEPDASFSLLWEVNSLLPQTTPMTDNWSPPKKQENPHIPWTSYTFIADANTDKVKTEAS